YVWITGLATGPALVHGTSHLSQLKTRRQYEDGAEDQKQTSSAGNGAAKTQSVSRGGGPQATHANCCKQRQWRNHLGELAEPSDRHHATQAPAQQDTLPTRRR